MTVSEQTRSSTEYCFQQLKRAVISAVHGFDEADAFWGRKAIGFAARRANRFFKFRDITQEFLGSRVKVVGSRRVRPTIEEKVVGFGQISYFFLFWSLNVPR
jgi:hypothetical protein